MSNFTPLYFEHISTNWILASAGESASLSTGRIKNMFNIKISVIPIKMQVFAQKPSRLIGMKIALDKK